MYECVVFDFDGLILDTETPLYSAWAQVFDHYGAPRIDLAAWNQSLGLRSDDPGVLDPLQHLRAAVDTGEADEQIQQRRRAIRDELVAA